MAGFFAVLCKKRANCFSPFKHLVMRLVAITTNRTTYIRFQGSKSRSKKHLSATHKTVNFEPLNYSDFYQQTTMAKNCLAKS
ncbi:hypothetical protein B1199_00510 [Pseudoalteromonas ulvae]|uniref:Uncharacterized protein n=1 Tax=Pseudoalteromonas ulvae TaxID=107327 RepID=A0A244CT46_PSEDV|nr:hypothetical protein B1199_00510 [Pseudoalteromonas ulvae]